MNAKLGSVLADVLVQSGRIIMKLRGVGGEVVWVGFEHSILVTVIYLPGNLRGGAISSQVGDKYKNE